MQPLSCVSHKKTSDGIFAFDVFNCIPSGFKCQAKNPYLLYKELDMENPKAIQILEKTVNLRNVTFVECVPTEGDTEKSLTVFFTSGHKMGLFKGSPVVCDELYGYVNTALGALNLTDIAKGRG